MVGILEKIRFCLKIKKAVFNKTKRRREKKIQKRRREKKIQKCRREKKIQKRRREKKKSQNASLQ